MKQLSEYSGENIKFSQPSFFKRFHELRVNDELIGTLQQRGFFGMRWEVFIQNKNWEIYRPSCWRTALEIRETGYEMPFASFKRDGLRSKGTLSLPKGEQIKIVPHLFKGFCEITNERDECLVKIKPKVAMGDKAEVVIEKKSETLDKYPWLIMLAYIITVEQRHQAAHSAG
ncbi:MAG: hypothetical protein NTX65_09900 [Ignavibacteriales bacterium]|nr:hypothetical protein [Ignavibacteriales bacterium]